MGFDVSCTKCHTKYDKLKHDKCPECGNEDYEISGALTGSYKSDDD